MFKKIVLSTLAITFLPSIEMRDEDIKLKQIDKFFMRPWYLLYRWPKEGPKLPNCMKFVFKKYKEEPIKVWVLDESALYIPYLCNCTVDKMDLYLLKQINSGYKKPTTLLVDVVTDKKRVDPALDKYCNCDPYMDVSEVVFKKITDDCFFYYRKEVNIYRRYLLCDSAPLYDEELFAKLYDIEELRGEIRARKGKKMCPADLDDDAKVLVKDWMEME